MSGKPKLNRKQEAVIAALLTEPTHAAAAAKARVSEATLHRWLRLPDFQSAYREARRRVVEGAIGRLQQVTNKAVDTLERNLACGQPGSEIRAALGVLDHAVKAVELVDLVERVEELEQLLNECKRDEHPQVCRETAGTGPAVEQEPPAGATAPDVPWEGSADHPGDGR
jgi:hypothetical protein